MPTAYALVLITVPDEKTAEKISSTLVEARLAACVSSVPGLKSVYWWEGKLERAQESLLLVKTRLSLTPDVVQAVRENHPSKVPEVVVLPIEGGNKDYLDWIGASTPFIRSPESDLPAQTP